MLKIGDFGMARDISDGDYYRKLRDVSIHVSLLPRYSIMCGVIVQCRDIFQSSGQLLRCWRS